MFTEECWFHIYKKSFFENFAFNAFCLRTAERPHGDTIKIPHNQQTGVCLRSMGPKGEVKYLVFSAAS